MSREFEALEPLEPLEPLVSIVSIAYGLEALALWPELLEPLESIELMYFQCL